MVPTENLLARGLRREQAPAAPGGGCESQGEAKPLRLRGILLVPLKDGDFPKAPQTLF